MMSLRMKESFFCLIAFGIVPNSNGCPYLQKKLEGGDPFEDLMAESKKHFLRGGNHTTRELQTGSCGNRFCYDSFDWGNDKEPQRFSFSELVRLSSIASNYMQDDQTNVRCRGGQSCLESMDTDTEAGYTFVGQLLSHDMNFDGDSTLGRIVEPTSLANGNTPYIDLDCIYGFQEKLPELVNGGKKFSISAKSDRDFPRDGSGRARIPDSRNDEHRILSQITVAMMTLHNQFADTFDKDKHPNFENAFEFAKARTIQTWQSIILHDLLPSLVDPVVLDLVKDPSQRLLYVGSIRERKGMPVEFSTAAYRLIHSRSRESYRLNSRFGASFFDTGAGQRNLLGGSDLPDSLVIEWENFFGRNAQKGRIMDMMYAQPLLRMPTDEAGLPSTPTTIHCRSGSSDNCPIDASEEAGNVRGKATANLALLDLARSVTHKVHGGRFCARRLRRLEELKAAESRNNPRPGVAIYGIHDFRKPKRIDEDLEVFGLLEGYPGNDIPLLLYLAYESLFEHEGKLLGWMGSRILAETIISLIEESPFSILGENQFISTITGREDVTMVDVLCAIGWLSEGCRIG